MRKQTLWLKGKWQSLRMVFAGVTLATTVLCASSPNHEWIGQTAEASQVKPAAAKAVEPVTGRPVTGNPITAAYVYDGKGTTYPQSTAAYLDQLNFSFALIKNGKVTGSHWQSIGAFKKFIAANPHITPVMAVGGWGADGFSQAASTDEGRKLFTKSALALMEEHGFLGIDIDWEYPGVSAAGIKSSTWDKTNFTLLLCELREGIDKLTVKDGKKRLLCAAVGADKSLVKKIDCVSVGKLVDQLNLMTYDMHQETIATHHANMYSGSGKYPASAETAVQDYVNAGIPRHKIMLGAAFYGRAFKTGSAANGGLYASSKEKVTKHYSYATIKSMLDKGTAKRYYDDKAQAPYIYDGQLFISYDDPTSIAHKGYYVRLKGLMGMMCWQYGDDANGELLRAMKKSLTRQ